VDEPNTQAQETSVYAESIARNIFIQLLPYMNIFPDEEGYTQDNVSTVTCTNGDLLNHNYQSYDNGIEVNDYGQTYGTDSSTESSTAQAGTYDENGNYISNGQTHSVEQEITDQTVGETGISDTNLADTPQDTGTDQTQTDNSYYSDGITNEDAQYYQDTVYQDTAYNGG
jgi:stage V sporulation protein D (sporulation-specific penicillin-binding protein)